jgi:hypothetical protein
MEAKTMRPKMTSLKGLIQAHPLFDVLDPDRKAKLLTGHELYVHGLRRVFKDAGWDGDHFYAMYNVLSTYAHGAPMSFRRDLSDPAEPAFGIAPDHEYRVAAVALEYATRPLGFACERMFETYPEAFLKGQAKH